MKKIWTQYQDYCIISLTEIKIPIKFMLPGYNCFTTQGENRNRGGCAILVKNELVDDIAGTDCSAADYIALRLKSLPNLQIIACYLASSDSLYASAECLTYVSGEIHENPENDILLTGDLNCKLAVYGTSSRTKTPGRIMVLET